MTKVYNYSWTCKNCEENNVLERTKFQAAFDHSPKVPPCKKCGGSKWTSAASAMPEVDTELLEMWFADPELYFLDQDEDLIMAGADLNVLKAFLEVEDNKSERAQIMGPILAVKLYDNTFDEPSEREWCIDWLIEQKGSWVRYTSEYIIKIVQPLLKARKSERKSKQKD